MPELAVNLPQFRLMQQVNWLSELQPQPRRSGLVLHHVAFTPLAPIERAMRVRSRHPHRFSHSVHGGNASVMEVLVSCHPKADRHDPSLAPEPLDLSCLAPMESGDAILVVSHLGPTAEYCV